MPEFHLPRKATQVLRSGKETRALSGWRDLDAYVLLGDPGSGKTSAMEQEYRQTERGVWASARDVIAGLAPDVPSGGVVFIDGLDEVRAGEANRRTPFDQIRRWLQAQQRPRLRLSCREADWLGDADLRELAKVVPGAEVQALHLEPLDDDDILAILARRQDEVPDAQAFWEKAEQSGLKPLLGNALMLDLCIRSQAQWWAPAGGDAPPHRAAIYEAACRELALERNDEHQVAKRPGLPGDVPRLLDGAGWLCALSLLSGQVGISESVSSRGGQGILLSDLPADETLPPNVLHDALRSKLFTGAGLRVPIHRTVAEYLAAGVLAQRVGAGLPLGRVMALMQGGDGVPVDPLRGLWAWLAVRHVPARVRLMGIDPMGFVLNGDVAVLTHDERLHLLAALREALDKDPWLREQSWNSPLFGPLARSDMAPSLQTVLSDHSRELGHQSLLDCLFDALRDGDVVPGLAPDLVAWVEDGQARTGLRAKAYHAWKRSAGECAPQALAWLQAIRSGTLADDEDELCGALLADLYPAHIPPSEVFAYWHPAKRQSLYGNYKRFWNTQLWAQTADSQWEALGRGWQSACKHLPAQANEGPDDIAATFSLRLRDGLVSRLGDTADDGTVYEWLGLGMDQYGSTGHRYPSDHPISRAWLEARPERMKSLFRHGLWKMRHREQEYLDFRLVEARLLGALRPRDWLQTLLQWATEAPNEPVAEYCFNEVAYAVLSSIDGMDVPSMEDVEQWVQTHHSYWPNAAHWLEAAWSMPIDHWRAEEYRLGQKRLEQQRAAETARAQTIAPHWSALLNGTAPVRLLYNIALAHDRGFTDIGGDTPLERVQNLLLCTEVQAGAVLAALPKVLEREDLPTVAEILQLEAQGRQHLLRPALLLAARLAHAQNPRAPLHWPRTLVEPLIASYLSDGTGGLPAWYRVLAQHRPEWVAPVLVRYAAPKFKRSVPSFVARLWDLTEGSDYARLAALALPSLLQAVPRKASEATRSLLNRTLLPALATLPAEQAQSLVRSRLECGRMDPGQTLAWLVAELPFRSEAANELVALVGDSERRAVMLGIALNEQDVLKCLLPRLAPTALRRLIEVLAPITSSDRWGDHAEGVVVVTAAHERSDTVHVLCAALADDPSPEAAAALDALGKAPTMVAWRTVLRYGQRTQAARAREAHFQLPSAEAVAWVLANQTPAQPFDLRALVVQHLQDLQAQWRGRDVYALKQFWENPSEDGRAPHIENNCRDLVLEKLRFCLSALNINVSSEFRAAQDKRADLCVEYLREGRRISLPVEVKKADHEHLWTAWRDQLQRLYTTDPDAQGCGLYLVLWFGERWRKTHPEGLPLRSAQALEQAVQARIPQADRHRLAVLALDLSWPGSDTQVHAEPG